MKKQALKQGARSLVEELKKPLGKDFTFALRVRYYLFDGFLAPQLWPFIPFTNPAFVRDFPFYLFCDFDKQGGYSAGFKLLKGTNLDIHLLNGGIGSIGNPPTNWVYNGMVITGTSNNNYILAGNSLFDPNFTPGTILFMYTPSWGAVMYLYIAKAFVFAKDHCGTSLCM